MQEARRINVQPYLVRGGTRSVWTLDTHRQVMATSWRRKRSVDDTVRIVLDGKLGETFFSLNLQPRRRHPVTSDTIIEWVDEDGQRTMWRAEDMAHCWYSGHVEHQNVILADFFLKIDTYRRYIIYVTYLIIK